MPHSFITADHGALSHCVDTAVGFHRRSSVAFLSTNNLRCASHIEQYEKDAQKLWERFYRRHGVHFFKDRHYLHREFPELLSGQHPFTILEVVLYDTDRKGTPISNTFRLDAASATAAFHYSKCYPTVRSGQSTSLLVPLSFSATMQSFAPRGFTRLCSMCPSPL